MKKTQTKDIGGYTYAVTQMGALRARRVITRFLQLAGGAIGAIVAAKGDASRADAIAGAVSGITDENMEFFYKEFAQDTVVTVPSPSAEVPDRVAMLKNDAAFDDIFVDRYGDMFQWLVFAFEVNFGNFFVGEGSLLTSLATKFGLKATPSPSESPKG